jgi:hypothetical protein
LFGRIYTDIGDLMSRGIDSKFLLVEYFGSGEEEEEK